MKHALEHIHFVLNQAMPTKVCGAAEAGRCNTP